MSLSLPVTIALDAVLVTSLVVTARQAPKVWRNEIGYSADDPPPSWLWGPASWRGYHRALTGAALLFWCPAAAAMVAATVSRPGWVDVLSQVAFGLAGVALLIGVPAVWLFNRPKWLVAPHLRHQPGAIAEFFGAAVAPTLPPERPSPLQPWEVRYPGEGTESQDAADVAEER
jgi:hypothetical protein